MVQPWIRIWVFTSQGHSSRSWIHVTTLQPRARMVFHVTGTAFTSMWFQLTVGTLPVLLEAKMDNTTALEIVFEAIDVVNGLRLEDEQVPRDPEVILVGPGGALDSLALVTLILSVETGVKEATGVDIVMWDNVEFGDNLERIRTPEAIAKTVIGLVS